MIRLDPPGTLCQNQAVIEVVASVGARTFLEVGVGTGSLSQALCRRGLRGVGIEFSPSATTIAKHALERQIASDAFRLIEGDFMTADAPRDEFDVAVSMMVMEHIEDDRAFVQRLVAAVRPGGAAIVGVPARMDHWGIEDEAAGHFRRYERKSLHDLFSAAGLEGISVRSVSVPVANIAFRASNFLVQRAGAARKLSLSQRERTELSGLHDVPFKTMFPSPFKLLFNPVAMYPAFVLQRAFYGTGLGLTLVASGMKPG
jgi:SAM-dependent methyltransferase